MSPLAETLWPGLTHPLKAPPGFSASFSRKEVNFITLSLFGSQVHSGVEVGVECESGGASSGWWSQWQDDEANQGHKSREGSEAT